MLRPYGRPSGDFCGHRPFRFKHPAPGGFRESDIRVAVRLDLQRRRLVTAASPGALKRSSSAQGPVYPQGNPWTVPPRTIRPR